MSKHLARLARADYHPGTAVLRDVCTGQTYLQFPMTSARQLLGQREEAFYFVAITREQVNLGEELPVEQVDAWKLQNCLAPAPCSNPSS